MAAYVKWWVRDRISGRTLRGSEPVCPDVEKLPADERRVALQRIAADRALGMVEFGARLVDSPEAKP